MAVAGTDDPLGWFGSACMHFYTSYALAELSVEGVCVSARGGGGGGLFCAVAEWLWVVIFARWRALRAGGVSFGSGECFVQ